jgi:hypothetical protein
MLNEPTLMAEFEKFLQNEFAVENMKFMNDVRRFKHLVCMGGLPLAACAA